MKYCTINVQIIVGNWRKELIWIGVMKSVIMWLSIGTVK